MVFQLELLVLKLCQEYLLGQAITLFSCLELVVGQVNHVFIQFFKHEVKVPEAGFCLATQDG